MRGTVRIILGWVPALSLAVLAACTTVQPWEHGTLAKPVMSVEDPPQEKTQKLRTYGAKEGGSAATGVGGGGCGCN
jgi:hypothetical protein